LEPKRRYGVSIDQASTIARELNIDRRKVRRIVA
jgi:hypothetical protein